MKRFKSRILKPFIK